MRGNNPLVLMAISGVIGIVVGTFAMWSISTQAEDGPVKRVYDRLDLLVGLVVILVLIVAGGLFYA